MLSSCPSSAVSIAEPHTVSIDDVEPCFHYVLRIPFPGGAVPVAVHTLHGSTCNDICRVTVHANRASLPSSPTPSEEVEQSPSQQVEYFMKSCRGVKRGEILLEAGGLALLHLSGLPVPPVLLAGEVDGTAYFAEPFIHSGKGTVPNWHLVRDEAAAGRALACLHRHRSPDGRFGCRRVAASMNTGDVEAPAALRAAFQNAVAAAPTSPSRQGTLLSEGSPETTSADACFDAGLATAAAEAYVSTFVWSWSWPELYLCHLLQPQVTRAQQRGLWSAARQRMFDVFAERFRAHFATRALLAAEATSGLELASTHSSSSVEGECGGVHLRGTALREDAEGRGAQEESSPVAALSVTECSLLHGDIWGGNLLFDTSGSPTFIDPQPLYGDREMDIALTQFFGGFGSEFYAAYEAAYPLDEDADMRVPWYQLYYAMMHLNLFGEAYGRAVDELLQAV